MTTKTDKPEAIEMEGDPAWTWVPLTELKGWQDNPRVNDHAVPEVAASITRFGFASPIVARAEDREIIAGHTRAKAAHSLNMDRVPVRYMDLTAAEAHALALADNRVAEIADWSDGLGDVLRALDEEGVELNGLGWSPDELDTIMNESAPERVVPEIVFSEVIGECNHYVVLKFESDIDWLQARTVLDIPTVHSKRKNGKPWSAGIGRVLDGPTVIAKIAGVG